jgi:hypothetical protein
LADPAGASTKSGGAAATPHAPGGGDDARLLEVLESKLKVFQHGNPDSQEFPEFSDFAHLEVAGCATRWGAVRILFSPETERYRILMRGEGNAVLVNHYALPVRATASSAAFSYTVRQDFADDANKGPQRLRFVFESETIYLYFAHKFQIAVQNNTVLIIAQHR